MALFSPLTDALSKRIRAITNYVGTRVNAFTRRSDYNWGTKIDSSPDEQQAQQEYNENLVNRRQHQIKEKPSKIQRKEQRRIRRNMRMNDDQMTARKRLGARGKHRGASMHFFSPQKVGLYEKKRQEIETKIKQLTGDKQNITLDYLTEKDAWYARQEQTEKLSEEHQAFKLLSEEYIATKLKLTRSVKANAAKTDWQRWDPGDVPKKSARRRLIEMTRDQIVRNAGMIPYVGNAISAAGFGYSTLKVLLDETIDASANIATGTRSNSSIARIVGTVFGAIIGGAILGVTFAFLGSTVPFAGTAVAGTLGIVSGAILGASIGGRLGMKAARLFSEKIPALRDEYDYQMDYVHLRQLKKLYGFNEEKILSMYSYLSNQMKHLGKDDRQHLKKLRTYALEEGREKSLATLCMYFISQEELLRSAIYDLAHESMLNQAKRTDLLKKRFALIAKKPEDIKEKLHKIDKALLKNTRQHEEISDKRFEMTRERDAILEILTEFQNPSEQYRSSSGKIKQIHVYHNMLELKPNGSRALSKDKITQLFLNEEFLDKKSQHVVSYTKPIDVRAFGETGYPYAIDTNNSVLMESKTAFVEDMRQHCFEYAKQTAHSFQLREIVLDSEEEKAMKFFGIQSLIDIQKALEQAMNLLENIDAVPPHKLDAFNREFSFTLFNLRKAKQLFEEESNGEFKERLSTQQYNHIIEDLEYNLTQLSHVMHFLQYTPLMTRDKKSELGLPEDSPVRDILGFTVLDDIAPQARPSALSHFSSAKLEPPPPPKPPRVKKKIKPIH